MLCLAGGEPTIQDMRIMFKVLKRPIKYLLDTCKEKLKLAMKNILKEIICSVISIFIGYNENVTYTGQKS